MIGLAIPVIESSRWLTQASCVGCDFSVNIVISRPDLKYAKEIQNLSSTSRWSLLDRVAQDAPISGASGARDG